MQKIWYAKIRYVEHQAHQKSGKVNIQYAKDLLC